MRYTFRATRICLALGLAPDERVTIDADHPEYLLVERQIAPDANALLAAILDGSIEDEFSARPAEEVRELTDLVIGLDYPRPHLHRVK